ncbi:MAG: lysophospholipid acyltransferase family protein [Gammaproteobacteria bacterium]|jgi:1-acyl-sn-glycerol-3-phosphate acyltransferase
MKLLRSLYYGVFIRFIVWIVLGLNVRHRERLPVDGPAVIVANHNSHLDTMVLITLLPFRLLPRVRPVAALDYFMSNPWLAWFAVNIVGILPIPRKREENADPLAPCREALARGEILIFFPEGTRGEPEKLASFKKGISYLAEGNPDVPVYPIFLHGLGKALPKGEAVLVPFFCDVFVGEPLHWLGNRERYMGDLDASMHELSQEGNFAAWE